MSAIQKFHLALDLITIGTCGFALYQWRRWMLLAGDFMRRAHEAETAKAGALIFARHCHDKFVRLIRDTEPASGLVGPAPSKDGVQ